MYYGNTKQFSSKLKLKQNDITSAEFTIYFTLFRIESMNVIVGFYGLNGFAWLRGGCWTHSAGYVITMTRNDKLF
jgi:hypothetical protein